MGSFLFFCTGHLMLGSDPDKYLLLRFNCFKKALFYLLKPTFRGQKQHFKAHQFSSNFVRFHLKTHHIAFFAGKFHPDHVDSCTLGAVLVGIAFVFDLLQSPALGKKFHNFKFKNVDMCAQFHRHVNAAMACGVFHEYIQPQGCKIAIDNRGVITLVIGQFIFAIPVMGDGGKKRLQGLL